MSAVGVDGVDIAWARPTTAQIKATGAHFVARYLSPDSTKNITAAEVKDYAANGLAVVVVWEASAGRMLGGYAAGQADAHAAEVQRAAVGLPADQVIYFACDFDAQGSQYHTVNEYLRGVNDTIGLDRTGVYGGYYVIENVFSAPARARYGWQTVAWSNGHRSAHAAIYQDGSTLLGGIADRDTAETADYGQYPRPSASKPPAPTPAPVPATFLSASKVIQIAANEVGYHEGKDANGVWDNIQKYSEQVPGLLWSDGQPWCCVFVAWVAMKANLASLYPRTADCATAVQWFKDKGRFSSYPAIGSQVFFGTDGGAHTGIVYKYDANKVYFVSGNSNSTGAPQGDGVYFGEQDRTATYVYGYGLPAFSEGIVTADPNLSGKAGYHYAAEAAATIGEDLPTPKDVWAYENGQPKDAYAMLVGIYEAVADKTIVSQVDGAKHSLDEHTAATNAAAIKGFADVEALKSDVAELKALLSSIAKKVGL
jgi:hypothetical protein